MISCARPVRSKNKHRFISRNHRTMLIVLAVNGRTNICNSELYRISLQFNGIFIVPDLPVDLFCKILILCLKICHLSFQILQCNNCRIELISQMLSLPQIKTCFNGIDVMLLFKRIAFNRFFKMKYGIILLVINIQITDTYLKM